MPEAFWELFRSFIFFFACVCVLVGWLVSVFGASGLDVRGTSGPLVRRSNRVAKLAGLLETMAGFQV